MKKVWFRLHLSLIILAISLFSSAFSPRLLLAGPEAANRNKAELHKIDKTRKEFSFAVFGDNRDSGATFGNLLESLNKDDLLFGIDAGDLVGYGNKEQYDIFLKEIAPLKVPFLTAIGNHDATGDGRSLYHEIFGSFYYSFTVGESYFIVLDASYKKDFDLAQMTWLEGELEKSQSFKNRFVFMHIPLYDPRAGEYKPGHSLEDPAFARKLNDLFDKSKVTMLFASHIHGYFTGTWGKTPFIITGGAGAGLYGLSDDHYFHHFIRVRVENDGVKYEIVKVNSPNVASAKDRRSIQEGREER